MAIINTLRNKMGKIVVVVIVLTMLSFIFTDLIGNTSDLGGGGETEVGVINGEGIPNTQFQQKVDELSSYFALNVGRSPNQTELDAIRAQAWNAMIIDKVYDRSLEDLGIVVTDNELRELVQGNNVSPYIRQLFTNPQTGEFSKDNVTNFLASISQATPQQQASWYFIEKSLASSRKLEKMDKLMSKTQYATKYEAKDEYESQNNSESIEYVYVPFYTFPDSLVDIKDSDLKQYMSDHSEEYQVEESRSFEYVIFPLTPSVTDSSIVIEEVEILVDGLAKSVNDSIYATTNSDDPLAYITYTSKEEIPTVLQNQEVGFTSEPTIVNGAYEIYKFSAKNVINADTTQYVVAKIKKEFFVSNETTNEIYTKADIFASESEDLDDFRTKVAERGLKALKATNVDKNASRVEMLNDARSLVLWLFNEAQEGEISGVREIGDNYVIAVMTEQQDKGLADLEEIRNKVELEVKNEKKSHLIIEKLKGLSADSLTTLAQVYGDKAKHGTADVQYVSSSISGVGYAPQAVGLAFAMDINEQSLPFKVANGVMIIKIVNQSNADELESYQPYVQQVLSKRQDRSVVVSDFPLSYFSVAVSSKLDNALKELAGIEDMRYRFF